MTEVREFDHVVVGSGSAGSVVARRLVDAGRTVLLIEAGSVDSHPSIRPLDGMLGLRGSENDWARRTEPQSGLGGRRIEWPRGKVLGGSSAINAMIYVRGHRADYDAWAYGGADGWSYDEVLPYFRRSEDFARGADDFHGEGGPLPVWPNADPHPLSVAILEAAVQSGYPATDDHNGADIYGVAYTHLNARGGERFSAWRSFGEPSLASGRLTVLTDTLATRVVFDGTRAVGVEVLTADGLSTYSSRSDVVLAAGALASPQLLQLSGIGPADALRALGIDVRVDLPGVGENLHDHAISQVAWRTQRPVDWHGHPPLEVQLFADSRPGLISPDLQPVTGFFAYPVEGYDFPAGDCYAWFPGIVRPRSRGRLWLDDADPRSSPRFDPGYLTEQVDVDALVEAIRICREIGRAPALAEWNAGEIAPGPGIADDDTDALRAYARLSLDTYFHPVGTCRMGVDSAAVVDPRLRVIGVEGLRVADASIFPEIPAGNTHAPSVMVGERAADFILTEDGR
jgi:choline dehydrogenase